MYVVISVKMDLLPASTKIGESTRWWPTRMRFFHSWADWGRNERTRVMRCVCVYVWMWVTNKSYEQWVTGNVSAHTWVTNNVSAHTGVTNNMSAHTRHVLCMWVTSIVLHSHVCESRTVPVCQQLYTWVIIRACSRNQAKVEVFRSLCFFVFGQNSMINFNY